MEFLWVFCGERKLTVANFKKAVTSIITQNRVKVKEFHKKFTNKKTEHMFGLKGMGSGYTPVLFSPAHAASSRPAYTPAREYCSRVSVTA